MKSSSTKTSAPLKTAKLESLFVTINVVYSKWDDGKMSDEEALEAAAQGCREFLAASERETQRNPSAGRTRYMALFPNMSKAVEFERQILWVGKRTLPPSAVAVLKGKLPTKAYWDFLIDQWTKMNDFGKSLAKRKTMR